MGCKTIFPGIFNKSIVLIILITSELVALMAYSNQVKKNFLPEAFKKFLKHRTIELLGIGLGCLSLVLFVSFFSYHPQDISLNTETSGDTLNILSAPGAYASDFMVQFLGISSLSIPLILVFWSREVFLDKTLKSFWIRFVGLLLSSLFCALACTPLTFIERWLPILHPGGLLGLILSEELMSFMPVSLSSWWWVVIAAIGAFVFFTFSSGIRWVTWRTIIMQCVSAIRWGLQFIFASFEKKTPLETVTIEGKRFASSENARQPTMCVKKLAPKRPDDACKGGYRVPSLDFLHKPDAQKKNVNMEQLQQNTESLARVLEDFGVRGEVIGANPGPVVVLYKLHPAPGIKSSRVIGLSDDIARSMSAVAARIAVVPGENMIGIELPNQKRQVVYLRELLSHSAFSQTKMALPMALGKSISGNPVIADLARMPHLLVAGTTGSGKSVSVNTMILSLLYNLTPKQCRFIMIDPKMLELSMYDGIPHLLTPVVTDPMKAVAALKWAVREMEHRYQNMSKLRVRNIDGYNQRVVEAKENGETITRRVQTGFDAETGRPTFEEQEMETEELPYIVIIIDEMADLMLVSGKDIEATVQRLAQMARAAGIHLIMATQRPSVDVITGTIKANFPIRISFQVTSKIDSRTILGEQGAEQLLGQGDMLYMASGGRMTRVHGPFVGEDEVERIVQFLKTQGTPSYIEEVTHDTENGDIVGAGGADKDPLYCQALELMLSEQKASTSFVQRHLKIGYNRAARLIDQMEANGVISAANHVGRRTILVDS